MDENNKSFYFFVRGNVFHGNRLFFDFVKNSNL